MDNLRQILPNVFVHIHLRYEILHVFFDHLKTLVEERSRGRVVENYLQGNYVENFYNNVEEVKV